MTLSIIIPNIRFPRRTQLYDVPSLSKNHVFSVYGEDQEKSLVNLNVSQPDGFVFGSADFSDKGVKILGNTNSIRYPMSRPLSSDGCTLMAMYRTDSTVGDSGIVSLWSTNTTWTDNLNRRIIGLTSKGNPIYSSNPGATDDSSLRPQSGNTEYLISMTRAAKGSPSVLRRHNADGSVAVSSPINENTSTSLTYAADAVFDVGMASTFNQIGVFVKGAAMWTGAMTEAEVVAAAAFMYQVTHG